MNLTQTIETYLKGWELADGELSLSATADSFYYDDPNSGRIPREEFVKFVNDFKLAAVEMGADEDAHPFLHYSDIVVKDDELPATVWCWWQANGTSLQGSAVIKVSGEGVLNERIAYFSRLPE